MKEELVTFKTAKLADEKGFDWICTSHIDKNNKTGEILNHVNYGFKCPTQGLLQKWLRDTSDTHLNVWYNTLTEKHRVESSNDWLSKLLPDSEYHSYEEALEVGLEIALIHIKERKL